MDKPSRDIEVVHHRGHIECSRGRKSPAISEKVPSHFSNGRILLFAGLKKDADFFRIHRCSGLRAKGNILSHPCHESRGTGFRTAWKDLTRNG